MGKVDPAKVASMRPKKKCCRSSKRCLRCPVVINRMGKLDTSHMSKKQLGKALRKARSA